MEGTLLVTPEQLQTASGTFSSKATQVKALHDSMISRVNTLCGTWEGTASETYKAKFAALQANMDTLNRMIMEHSNDLNAMAEQYTTAETQAASAAEELPASTLA
ncbi:MAG: WXG100 family type VII secretion target [Lachnospiraceae bacterium]|nr:WXG100 family type VII secretion target [Lachnospiraceae bacterium]